MAQVLSPLRHTRQKYEQKYGPQTAESALFWGIWVIFCPDIYSYFCLVCGGRGSLAYFSSTTFEHFLAWWRCRDWALYRAMRLAIPLSHYAFHWQGIANYRCYTSPCPSKTALRNTGALQGSGCRILLGCLQGIAYRGIARELIANCEIGCH